MTKPLSNCATKVMQNLQKMGVDISALDPKEIDEIEEFCKSSISHQDATEKFHLKKTKTILAEMGYTIENLNSRDDDKLKKYANSGENPQQSARLYNFEYLLEKIVETLKAHGIIPSNDEISLMRKKLISNKSGKDVLKEIYPHVQFRAYRF